MGGRRWSCHLLGHQENEHLFGNKDRSKSSDQLTEMDVDYSRDDEH
nr:hypothetical protein Itr_chr12CG28280 [Ipomoea trifida]